MSLVFPPSGTNLSIAANNPVSGAFTIQYFSGRNIKQSLDEIDPPGKEALLQRSGNGNFISFVRPQFQKLRSVIDYSDYRPPVFNDSWVGQTMVVNCAIYRWRTGGQSADRSIVPGSTVIGPTTDNNYGYLPQLAMTLKSWTCNFDERKHIYSGRIVMEES